MYYNGYRYIRGVMTLEKQAQMKSIRCIKCNKLLLKLDGRAEVKCPKCKHINTFDTNTNKN